MEREYTEGIVGDGVAILEDGVIISPSMAVEMLNLQTELLDALEKTLPYIMSSPALFHNTKELISKAYGIP